MKFKLLLMYAKFSFIFRRTLLCFIPVIISVLLTMLAYIHSSKQYNDLINLNIKSIYIGQVNEIVYSYLLTCFELLLLSVLSAVFLLLFKKSKKIKYTESIIFGLVVAFCLAYYNIYNLSTTATEANTKLLNQQDKIYCLLNKECNKIYKNTTHEEHDYLKKSFYQISELCKNEQESEECIVKHLKSQYPNNS